MRRCPPSCPRFQLLGLGLRLGLDTLTLGQVDPWTTDYEPMRQRKDTP